MSNKVTMKDIARALNVTTTTVHRALQGKEGVSDEMRQKIQKMAVRLGYRSNYIAATLKGREIRIAIALPKPVGDSRFYYENMWLGIRRFLNDIPEFNVLPLEYTYDLSSGANGMALKTIYEQNIENLDGLLTMGVDQGQSSYFIEKFAERKIPIVLIGSDMYKDMRICTVKSCDEMAGSLAAELLTAFNCSQQPKKVIITGSIGQLGMTDQLLNAKGFEEYVQMKKRPLVPLLISKEDSASTHYEIERVLQNNHDVMAIYSTSARHTVYIAQVAQKLGIADTVKLIGNDCFPESLALLKQGILTAIIDKKVAHQSYLAMNTLFNYIVKAAYPPSSVIQVRPEVVLQSNVQKDWVTGELV